MFQGGLQIGLHWGVVDGPPGGGALNHGRLMGRKEVLSQIAGSKAPITLLAGDSGIGKSALLEEEPADTELTLSSVPITVGYTRAAVHAVLSALAEVAHRLSLEVDATLIARTWVEASKNLASKYAQDLPRVLGAAMLGFLKARIGTAGGKILDDFVSEVRKSSPVGISAAITGQLDPLASDIIADFAEALLSVAPPGTSRAAPAVRCLPPGTADGYLTTSATGRMARATTSPK